MSRKSGQRFSDQDMRKTKVRHWRSAKRAVALQVERGLAGSAVGAPPGVERLVQLDLDARFWKRQLHQPAGGDIAGDRAREADRHCEPGDGELAADVVLGGAAEDR